MLELHSRSPFANAQATNSKALQEFPSATPAELGTASINLESLVHHREAVDAGDHLEQVQQKFRLTAVDYLVVERQGRVIGLCSRGQVGFVMGSRFGFAIYSKDCIDTVMVARPLIVVKGSPVRDVLQSALVRDGDDFKEDVVLVDSDRRLVGLIKVEVLAQLQSRLVNEQLSELQRQHVTLRQQNLELFRADNAARQSKGLYLGLFASHTLGVALLDKHGGIHEHNRRFSQLLDIGDSTSAAGSLTEWISEDERASFLSLIAAHALETAAPANHEFTFNIPGRDTRIFRCSMGWIKETGQICACFDDLTDQRALERKLLRQEKQTLLDTLVGGIAHELNNKLAPIMGFSELLKENANAADSEQLSLIVGSVEEAARIIRQLLELSKPASQSARALDLRSVAEETLSILRYQLRETGCSVRTLFPANPVLVMGDTGQLKQVFLNLVLNALHAMEGRQGPELTVEVRASGREAAMVVSDNGCGIEARNMSRIFDPFFTTKGPEKGTGLGLSVCFSIVRQLGGDIKVESEPGVGTRFTVALRHEPGIVLIADLQKSSSDFLPHRAAFDTRVLIVEDDVVLRRLLQEILCSKFGCRVELATNGLEGLEALKRSEFSMVLADIRMPVMSGTEFYLHLRELYPALARKFIFITGYPGDKEMEAEITRWNVPVVAKPFNLARLAEVCRPFLQNAKQTCA
jgi:two-component system cell cycle sensor histidine kinase/response regulator CckA